MNGPRSSSVALIIFLFQLCTSHGESGYCTWSRFRGSTFPSCTGKRQGGYCDENSQQCEKDCQGMWCEYKPSGSVISVQFSQATSNQPLPSIPFQGRKSPPKRATTTRYWDCTGGACGCAYLPFGDDDLPAHCHSNAMFAAPEENAYGAKFYGTAAISEALGGGNWLAEGCGKCWKVTGTSPITSETTTLVLKGTNFCPPSNAPCSGGKAHFDIAAPGFDVPQYSLSNTCDIVEVSELKGMQACSNWMMGNKDPSINCDCSLFNDPVLRTGCENFLSLKWDNPEVEYEEVNCPRELGQLPCWNENGGRYPEGVPSRCSDPLGV